MTMMMPKLCWKHLRFLKHSNLSSVNKRLLFSASNTWTGEFTRENRIKLEQYWKEKIKPEVSASQEHGKTKYYVLSMFPYPSGQLHMGHVRVYTISDAMARYHRLKGRHVIHPMGWDAFGLPAENAAIERQEMPDKWTNSNITSMKQQLEALNCSFDWSREFATCDPSYYKWTQYIFLKMFEKGLVYQKEAPVNWDPVDQTVLANEQVDENGLSWRSGAVVEKRFLRQWYIQSTKYFKSLLDGLSEVDTKFWRDVATLQKNLFGNCDGMSFSFKLQINGEDVEEDMTLYTSSPGAIYGASFIAVSHEHFLAYRVRQEGQIPETLCKDVLLPNIRARHPLTGELLPVLVSPNVNFGDFLDAIVGIPCANEEHKRFAESHNIPYLDVLQTQPNGSTVLVKSERFTGMTSDEAVGKIAEYTRQLGMGGHMISEKARDWLISRQRYWGTPIPLIHCPVHGAVAVPYEDLPVRQPKITEFLGKGKSPAMQDKAWFNTKCPKCGGPAHRETDTMDTFVDSSWYFMRYLDAHNENEPFSKEAAKQFMPVDLYIGGKEHATLHLYYARFVSHFLHEEGLLPTREPFVNLLTQGMVQAKTYQVKSTGKYIREDQVETKEKKKMVEKGTGEPVGMKWEKMSKSKHNGIDPQSVLDEFGCDSMRLFILGGVSPQSDRKWDQDVFKGINKWQRRVWNNVNRFRSLGHRRSNMSEDVMEQLNKKIFELRNSTIIDVNFVMEKVFIINAAITKLQILTNTLQNFPDDAIGQSYEFERALCDLIILMSPFSPMFASELWRGVVAVQHMCSHYKRDKNVLEQDWPVVDPHYRMDLKLQKNEKTVFCVKLPMPVGQEEGFSKYDAIELAKTHMDYSHHFDETKMFPEYLLQPGYSAYLKFTDPTAKKKKKKT